MSYNLLVDPLAPFLMASGEVRWLSVADIVAGIPHDDYAVEPAWPRADLDIATYELLIGLLSFAMPPKRHSEWGKLYTAPPGPDDLRAAVEPLLPAFNVDGDGPRFMQEADLDGDMNPVEALFIDTPGANGQKKNTDLLTHRGRYSGLCLPAAAMALYAMQAFAPAGGAGIRTSMRGGGSLTALVIPQPNDDGRPLPLWHKLWANVAPRTAQMPPPEAVFAWLRGDLALGKGAGGAEIHQGQPPFDEHLHPFFGMPRRMSLMIPEEPGTCSMTGLEGPLVTGFMQRPSGLNYGAWRHPLTPYGRKKAGETPYSLNPKSGRFGYRDWVAVTMGGVGDDEQKLSLAAENVQRARHQYGDALSADGDRPEARIRVAGWAMKKAKAISYIVAEQPLPLGDPSIIHFMDDAARGMAAAGDTASSALRYAVKTALGLDDDKGVVEQARIAFYERTDDAFHEELGSIDLSAGARGLEEANRRWLGRLRRAALLIFDEICPVPLEDAVKAGDIVQARARLISAFGGPGKTGEELYKTLRLPPPKKQPDREEVAS